MSKNRSISTLELVICLNICLEFDTRERRLSKCKCAVFCATLPSSNRRQPQTYATICIHPESRECCDRTSSHLQQSPAPRHGSRINLQLPVNSHVRPNFISAPNGRREIAKGGAPPGYFRSGYYKFIVRFYSWNVVQRHSRRSSHRLHTDRFCSLSSGFSTNDN